MRYQLSHCLLFYILLSPITLVFKETAFLASCLRYKKKRRVSYFNLWEHQTRLDQRHAQVSPWHHWTLIIWETRVQLGDDKTTNLLTAGAETRVNLTKVIDTTHCNKTLYLYGNQSASSTPTRRGTFLYTSIFLSITLLSQSFVDPVPTCLNHLAGIKLRINTYSQHSGAFCCTCFSVPTFSTQQGREEQECWRCWPDDRQKQTPVLRIQFCPRVMIPGDPNIYSVSIAFFTLLNWRIVYALPQEFVSEIGEVFVVNWTNFNGSSVL